MLASLRTGLSTLAQRSRLLNSRPLELAVDLRSADVPYAPGDRVHAFASLHARSALHVRELRLSLVRRERYERRDGIDLDDEFSETSMSARRLCLVDEQEIWRRIVLRDGVLAAGERHVWSLDAVLPVTAHPSWRGGLILDLAWLARVSVIEASGALRMAQADVPLGGAGAPYEGGSALLRLRPNARSDVLLRFALAGSEHVTGGAVSGHLVIDTQSDMDVRGVRVELERVEVVHEGTGYAAREKWAVRPAGSRRLRAGQTLALPFSVTVPHPRPVSGGTEHAAVLWLLRGVLESGELTPDVCAEEPIVISAGRHAS